MQKINKVTLVGIVIFILGCVYSYIALSHGDGPSLLILMFGPPFLGLMVIVVGLVLRFLHKYLR